MRFLKFAALLILLLWGAEASSQQANPTLPSYTTTPMQGPKDSYMAQWDGWVESALHKGERDPIRIYLSQDKKNPDVRILRYSNPGCLYTLTPIGGNVWREDFRADSGEDCSRYGGGSLEILVEQDAGLKFVRRPIGDPNTIFLGSADLRVSDYSEFCPLHPQPCDIWTNASLEASKKSRSAAVLAGAGAALPQDDGFRKPGMRDWEKCGRPFQFKTPLPQDTTFNYEALELVCVLDFGHPEWSLRIANTDFGDGFAITGSKPGMIVEGLGSKGFGVDEIEDVLNYLGHMQIGDAVGVTLTDPSKDCTAIDCRVSSESVKRRDPDAPTFSPLPVIGNDSVAVVLNIFLMGDFIDLEARLRLIAEESAKNDLANAILGPARALAPDFYRILEGYFSGTIIESRFAQFISDFGLMRMTLSGDCGEPTEMVSWTEQTFREYHNGFGHYVGRELASSTTFDLQVPLGFKGPFSTAGSARLNPEFSDALAENVRMLGCNDPRRNEIERNMLKFFYQQY